MFPFAGLSLMFPIGVLFAAMHITISTFLKMTGLTLSFLKSFLPISLFKNGERHGIQQGFLHIKACSNTINALKRAK